MQKHLPEIDAKTAQLAIDSCHDNEVGFSNVANEKVTGDQASTRRCQV